MLLLALYFAVTALYAWSDQNKVYDIDKGLVYIIKTVLAILASTGFLTFVALLIISTGIDRAVRGVITQTKPVDKESWWGKYVFKKYGQVWAERTVWFELLIGTLILLIWLKK